MLSLSDPLVTTVTCPELSLHSFPVTALTLCINAAGPTSTTARVSMRAER